MTEQKIPFERRQPQVNEMTLAEIFAFIKKYSLKISISSILFAAIGYAFSFLLAVSYTSTTTLLPESGNSSGAMSSLSSLARLGGLTRNEGNGAIQPDLYPTLLETVPFSLFLLKQPIVTENNHLYNTVQEFLHRNDEPNKRGEQKNKSTSKISVDILSLSKDEDKDSKQALRLISTIYDSKLGTITISSESPDPVISAQLVKLASDYLIEYVSNYRMEKTKREVEFLRERVTEAKKRQESAEFALQSYRDRNRGAFLNVARIEEQRLQADYLLAQTLYSEIVRRWEDSKLKLKEEQPVIKVIEPAKVPLVKSKPSRISFALFFLVTGIIMSSGYFLFKKKKI